MFSYLIHLRQSNFNIYTQKISLHQAYFFALNLWLTFQAIKNYYLDELRAELEVVFFALFLEELEELEFLDELDVVLLVVFLLVVFFSEFDE